MADNPHEEFNLYCKDHAVWLIKYASQNTAEPIYLLWYHDHIETGKSRLLTFHNGKIFAASSLKLLANNDIENTEFLNSNDKIIQFTKSLKDFSSYTITSFDMVSIMEKVEQNLLESDTLSWITDFLYLVEDYLYTNPNNIVLKELIADPMLQSVITYYNEHILWPSLSKANSAAPEVNPIFDIDHIILAKQLRKVVSLFDNSINYDGIAT